MARVTPELEIRLRVELVKALAKDEKERDRLWSRGAPDPGPSAYVRMLRRRLGTTST